LSHPSARELPATALRVRNRAWIRTHRREIYGATPTLDAAELIGESVALYEDVQASALRYAQSPTISVRDRLRCMHTAMIAREKMTALLQDVGLLNRAAPDLTIGLPTAAQIRQALETARPEQPELVFEAEQTWQPGDSDACAAAF
jgi:hypothetical protein